MVIFESSEMNASDNEPSANVTVISKIKHIKSFETPEEFNKYYIKHKTEIDGKTTNQLNREFSISGYKITKRNMRLVNGVKTGDLHLKVAKPSVEPDEDNDAIAQISEQIDDIYAKITQLNELYKKVAEVVNELCSGSSFYH